jgi:hypothetical protein
MAQKRVPRSRIDFLNWECAHVSAALNQSDDGLLLTNLAALAVGRLATDVAFVNLDDLELAAERAGYLAGRIASRRRCSMNHVDL